MIAAISSIVGIVSFGRETYGVLSEYVDATADAATYVKSLNDTIANTLSQLEDIRKLLKEEEEFQKSGRGHLFTKASLDTTKRALNNCDEVFTSIFDFIQKKGKLSPFSGVRKVKELNKKPFDKPLVLSRLQEIHWPYVRKEVEIYTARLTEHKIDLILVFSIARLKPIHGANSLAIRAPRGAGKEIEYAKEDVENLRDLARSRIIARRRWKHLYETIMLQKEKGEGPFTTLRWQDPPVMTAEALRAQQARSSAPKHEGRRHSSHRSRPPMAEMDEAAEVVTSRGVTHPLSAIVTSIPPSNALPNEALEIEEPIPRRPFTSTWHDKIHAAASASEIKASHPNASHVSDDRDAVGESHTGQDAGSIRDLNTSTQPIFVDPSGMGNDPVHTENSDEKLSGLPSESPVDPARLEREIQAELEREKKKMEDRMRDILHQNLKLADERMEAAKAREEQVKREVLRLEALKMESLRVGGQEKEKGKEKETAVEIPTSTPQPTIFEAVSRSAPSTAPHSAPDSVPITFEFSPFPKDTNFVSPQHVTLPTDFPGNSTWGFTPPTLLPGEKDSDTLQETPQTETQAQREFLEAEKSATASKNIFVFGSSFKGTSQNWPTLSNKARHVPTGLEDLPSYHDTGHSTVRSLHTTVSPESIDEGKMDNIADTITAILDSKDALLENPWIAIDDSQTSIKPDPHSDAPEDIKTGSQELVIRNVPDLRDLPNFNAMMYRRNSIADSIFDKRQDSVKVSEHRNASPSSISRISYDQSTHFSDERSLADSESAQSTALTSSGITSNLRRLFSYRKGRYGSNSGPRSKRSYDISSPYGCHPANSQAAHSLPMIFNW